MELHTVHLPCGINATKWNQLWAGIHLARVLTHISKSILWSTLQQQSYSHAQGSTSIFNLIHDFWLNAISISFPTKCFLIFVEIISPLLHVFYRYEPHFLKITTFLPNVKRPWLTSYLSTRRNMSSDVYISRYTNYFLSICQRIFHFHSMFGH